MSSLGINFDNDMKVNEYMRVDYSHSSPTLIIDKPSDKSVALNFPSVDYVEKPSDKFTLTIDNIIADTINFDTQDGRKERKFTDDGIFGTKSDDWGHLPYYNNYVPIVTANYTKLDSTANNDTLHNSSSANCYTFINIDFNSTDNCIIQFKYIKTSNDNIKLGFTDDNSDLNAMNTNLFTLSELNINSSGIIKIVKIKDKIYFYLNDVWKATKDFTLDDNYVFSFNYNNKVFYFKEFSMSYIDNDYDINKNSFNVNLVDSSRSTEDNIIYNNNIQPIIGYDTCEYNDRILHNTPKGISKIDYLNKINNKDYFNQLALKPIVSTFPDTDIMLYNFYFGNDGNKSIIVDIIDDSTINLTTNKKLKTFFIDFNSSNNKLTLKYYEGHDLIEESEDIVQDSSKLTIGFVYRNYTEEIVQVYPCYYDNEDDDWYNFSGMMQNMNGNGIVKIREVSSGVKIFAEDLYNDNEYLPITILSDNVVYNRTSTTYNNNIYNFVGNSEIISNGWTNIYDANDSMDTFNLKHGGEFKGTYKIVNNNIKKDTPFTFNIGEFKIYFETTNIGEVMKLHYSMVINKSLTPVNSGDIYCPILNNSGDGNGNILLKLKIKTDNYSNDNPNTTELWIFDENNNTYHTMSLNPEDYSTDYNQNSISWDNPKYNGYFSRSFDVYDDISTEILTYSLIKSNAINNLMSDKSNIVSNPFDKGKIKMVFTSDLSTNLLFEFYDKDNYYGFKLADVSGSKLLYFTSNPNDNSFNSYDIQEYQMVIGYLELNNKYYIEFNVDDDIVRLNNNITTFNLKTKRKLGSSYSNYYMDIFIPELKSNSTKPISNRDFINMFLNGNWNVGCGFISNITYEIPSYTSSLYSNTNNIINIHNTTDNDTIHLKLNHDFYGDNYIYMKFNDSSNNDYEKINIIFTSNKKINIALSDLYIDSDEFFFKIKDGRIIIYTYDDALITKVYDEIFDLEDNYYIIISGGDTTTICNLDIISFLVGKSYQEIIDDGIKNYNNANMVGSVDADVSADINGTTLQCSRVVGSGYLLPTVDGDYNNHLLINGSSEIEFDYIYTEDLYDHNKFGIGNRIGNQVEYITFNELDIDTDKHIKIKITNEYEQVGVNDMTANIKVYTAPISETNVYTNNDYTLKYDKDVSISLLRAGYYFVFKQQNRTSKIKYRNFTINVVCYDYNIGVECRGYTKEGVLDMYRSYEEYIPCTINTNENRLKVSFGNRDVNISKDIKYIEFYIIFADDRLTKIEISKIMLSEGIEDAPYSKDLKEENLKSTSIDFTRSYYCNYYNHHEADPVGLCIIRPTMESLNLTKIPAPLRDDGKGNQGTTILYPYLKNCKEENKPENVAVEYLNSCDQTLKVEYSG